MSNAESGSPAEHEATVERGQAWHELRRPHIKPVHVMTVVDGYVVARFVGGYPLIWPIAQFLRDYGLACHGSGFSESSPENATTQIEHQFGNPADVPLPAPGELLGSATDEGKEP